MKMSQQRAIVNYQPVLTVVMKNCEPLLSGPEFAIDKTPDRWTINYFPIFEI